MQKNPFNAETILNSSRNFSFFLLLLIERRFDQWNLFCFLLCFLFKISDQHPNLIGTFFQEVAGSIIACWHLVASPVRRCKRFCPSIWRLAEKIALETGEFMAPRMVAKCILRCLRAYGRPPAVFHLCGRSSCPMRQDCLAGYLFHCSGQWRCQDLLQEFMWQAVPAYCWGKHLATKPIFLHSLFKQSNRSDWQPPALLCTLLLCPRSVFNVSSPVLDGTCPTDNCCHHNDQFLSEKPIALVRRENLLQVQRLRLQMRKTKLQCRYDWLY